MEEECQQTQLPLLQFLFNRECRYHELWHVQRCKAARTCDENCLDGTSERL